MYWTRTKNTYRIVPLGEKLEGEKGMATAVQCTHRSKKGLFNTKEIRKKFKASPQPSCYDCDKAEEKTKETSELWVCVTCGQTACTQHSSKHTSASRTGEPHSLFFKRDSFELRCNTCDTEVRPSEESSSDPVKAFLNDIKSFIASKKTKPEKQLKEEKTDKNGVNSASVENGELAKGNGVKGGKTIEKADGGKKKRDTSTYGNNSNSLIPAKGLPNLGNTCFYNSVMQCMMHTHQLVYYLQWFGRVTNVHIPTRIQIVNEEKVELEEVDLPISSEGCPLNDALKAFIAEFQQSARGPSPSPLFSQISKKSPRFKGWQQQDAHELLRCLMDGIRSEEMEMYKSAIAKLLRVPNKNNAKNVDPAVAKLAKGYLQACGRPLLDAVFGGTLMQTIRCSHCSHISEKQEQFLDLSLPISSNPMRATAAGKMSAHQKKKAKKVHNKQTKRMAARGNANSNLNGAINELNLNESEDEEAENEEEGEEGQSGTESSTEGDDLRIAIESINFTKVLVPAPPEYSKERSLGNCLLEFTAEEILSGANSYECEKCCAPVNKKSGATGNKKKRVEAIKRYLILEPPCVLTLHLKRFQQIANGFYGRNSTRKIGGHVSFSLLFDIAPFCSRNVERVVSGANKLIYSLYGVVSHSGDLSGGHYIAYVKSRHRVPQALQFIEAARASSVDGLSFPPTLSIDTNNSIDLPSSDCQWYYCSDSHVTAVSESRVLGAEAYILFYERLV